MAEVRSRVQTKDETYGEVGIFSLDFFLQQNHNEIAKDKIVNRGRR